MTIDYAFVESAIKFYAKYSFRHIEVPWVVSSKAYNITAPEIGHKCRNKTIEVASGEQSLLQEILSGRLSVGRYVVATPCFRPFDDKKDKYHFGQFFKVELMNYLGLLPTEKALQLTMQPYDEIKSLAWSFFHEYLSINKLNLRVVETKDDPRSDCKTLVSHDIELNSCSPIELGSYGVRHSEKIGWWVYGTGLALPRFQQILEETHGR